MRIFFGIAALTWGVIWVGLSFFQWEVSASSAASFGALALAIICTNWALGGK